MLISVSVGGFDLADEENNRITAIMADDAPEGYIDPSFPRPTGDGDAPIIIYGYVFFICFLDLRITLVQCFSKIKPHVAIHPRLRYPCSL